MIQSDRHSYYVRIAQDLASRIADGSLAENSKLRGRSTLASLYNASPETIRRAIGLLEEAGVVCAEAGSGIRVLSRERARQYVLEEKQRDLLYQLLNEVYQLMEKEREIHQKLEEAFESLVEALRGPGKHEVSKLGGGNEHESGGRE